MRWKKRVRKNLIEGIFDKNGVRQKAASAIGTAFEDYFSELFTSNYSGTHSTILEAFDPCN